MTDTTAPQSYQEAIQAEDSTEWRTALQGELIPLYNKKCFSVVSMDQLPSHQRPTRSRRVLSYKDKDGVVTCKARLVACGYSQKFGMISSE